MAPDGQRPSRPPAGPILTASFLFNLGQGVLRPAMPLYLHGVFGARYQMVTLIPVVFGVGKWLASLPTGFLLMRLGRRPLMIAGLLLMACIDVGSVLTSAYAIFLGLRGLGGVGWAMFGTVATAVMVSTAAAQRRGRSVSVLLMSETLGLFVGSLTGGWLYQRIAVTTPFLFEAACMALAALVVATTRPVTEARREASSTTPSRRLLSAVVRIPGVLSISLTNALLIALQTGVLVFLFPLYLANHAGMSPQVIGLVIGLSALGRLVALWLGGDLSDRQGRLRVLRPGLGAYAALFAILPFLTDPILLALWSLASGAALGFVAPIPTALVGDRVPPHLHGVAVGWLRTITDTGHLLGPLLMGPVADTFGLAAPFFLGATLLLTAMWQCGRAQPVTMQPE